MISNFKLIRTLDLNGSGITVLPKSIGTCQHLRYLDLSKNWKLEMLPDSITNLLNLQTLRLNGCSRLQELPGDLKKLVNLRHLEIDGCYDLTHMPSGFSHLTNLQTLSKYVLTKSNGLVAKHGGKLKELMRLNYLRGKLEIPNWHVGKLTELMRLNKLRGKLEILNLRHGKDAKIEYEFANLKEKQYLRSLELKWNSNVDIDETEGPVGYEMSLEVLRPHPNLQELALANYGGVKISSWLSSLTNLVNLSLRWCTKCRHLVPLNQFHLLKKLELEDLPCLEYIDSEEDLTLDTTIVLPSLRELRLKNLPNLKGWWRDVVTNSYAAIPAFGRKPVVGEYKVEAITRDHREQHASATTNPHNIFLVSTLQIDIFTYSDNRGSAVSSGLVQEPYFSQMPEDLEMHESKGPESWYSTSHLTWRIADRILLGVRRDDGEW
ncbi:hypothetical protein TIFTF001_016551 [Ficus carica]|uniref:R13L1/DRL21-like LRR repeat region domain-containing protein n=1 Tax=Ficus carica TaxID=3494 RepID=A0AA88A6H6_FICCA|nr:hypothetical protein TIFTF001_016551 [Ficus carica]